MPTIAIIGTGNMGNPMAVNLKKSGFDVRAYDLIETRMDNLVPLGIVKTASHAAAIEAADFVLTMLPSGVEVSEVYEQQILKYAKPEALLIDSSTIDTRESKDIHAAARRAGYSSLDAPVSGGTVGAHNGALSFMVGGEKEDLDRAMPLFEAMGKAVVHCGSGGLGQAAKMCNNMMLAIQMSSVAEGFKLAEKSGLSHAKLFEVATQSSGNCFALTTFCPIPDIVPTAPSTSDYQPGFTAELMLKDLTLALNAAQDANLDLSSAKAVAPRYQQLVDQGRSDLDFSAIFTNIK